LSSRNRDAGKPAVQTCKGERRAFQQKDVAGLALGVADDPEAIAVASNEEGGIDALMTPGSSGMRERPARHLIKMRQARCASSPLLPAFIARRTSRL
jgi:hypothetical protein